MKTDSEQMDDEPDMHAGEEDFLSRWSRRKREAQQAKAEVVVTVERTSEQQTTLLTDADMPPLESLDEHSDYSGFLSPQVSEALRKQALRKLFQSPGFNIRDGLDDYDDDYTQFASLGDTLTADIQHRLEKQATGSKEQSAEEKATDMTKPATVEAEANTNITATNNTTELDTGKKRENEQS